MSTDHSDPLSADLADTARLEQTVEQLQRDTHKASIKRALFGGADEAPRIGRFCLLRVLGEGGMGTVYAAYDERLDRRVALKLVRGDGNDESRARMLREAQAMAKLSHPNVVPIFDVGEHEGHLYIAMEFVRGRTLAQWQHEDEPPFALILDKYLEAGRGLAAAHAEGIVHRDFKPHNAVVGTDCRVRVLDFGLAGMYDEPPQTLADATPLPRPAPGGLATPLTQTGTVMGTPAYMSPEQAVGDPIDHRSDQFAFCVALWEAVYGSRPFTGRSAVEIFTAAAKGDFREPEDCDTPAWFRPALERGLASRPEDRWPDMQQLIEQLSPPPPAPPRPRRWPMLTAIGLLVAGLVGLGWQRSQQCRNVAAELDDTWNPTRRQALRDEIAATTVAEAADTATQIDRALDSYAQAWRQQRREICETSRSGRGQSKLELLRLTCLESRQRALDALIGGLERPTAARVATALGAASQLPTIGSCGDDAYVAAKMSVPEEPARRAEVEAIRDELSQISSLAFVDQDSDDSIARLTTLEQRASAVQFPQVRLEVLNRLTWAYSLADDPERAMQAADVAYTLIGSPSDMAETLTLRAPLHAEAGDHHRAILEAKRALSLLETGFGHDTVVLYQARLALGFALLEQGHRDQALEQLRRARQVIVERVGEHHPAIGFIRSMEFAASLDYIHQLAQARRRVEEAEQADPPSTDALLSTLSDLSVAQMLTGDIEGCIQSAERALALIGDKPLDDPARIQAEVALTYGWLMRGEYMRALTRAREALAVFDAPPSIILLQSVLGLDAITVEALVALGRPQEALAEPSVMARGVSQSMMNRLGDMSFIKLPAYLALGHYQRAADDARQFITQTIERMGGESLSIAELYLQLGYALIGLGQYDDALSVLKNAETLVPESLPEYPALTTIAYHRGLVDWMRGEHASASSHLHQALTRMAATTPSTNPKLALVRAHIAAVQWNTGARDEAYQAMRDAVAAYREALGPQTPAVARGWGLLALMAEAQRDPATIERARTALHELEQANPGNETIIGVRELLDVVLADRRADPASIAAAAEAAHARGFPLLARFAVETTRARARWP
ncbi:MAG: protein kinase [Myxococcota bacterium]